MKTGLRAYQTQQTPTCTHNQSLIHLTPSLSICPSKTFAGKALVKGSAKFCKEAILVSTMSPLVYLGFLEFATAPLFSQKSIMGLTASGTTPSSMRNFLSQAASFEASEAT